MIDKKKIGMISMAMATAVAANADVTIVDKPDVKLSATGLIMFDGALFTPKDDVFADGVSLPEVRLGAHGRFGKFEARIDLGYGMQKFRMKDVYMQYNPDAYNRLRLGYFIHHFGLNASTGNAAKPMIVEQTPNAFFNANSRNLGLMYVYDRSAWFAAASLFASNRSLTEYANTQGKISVGALGRFLWRPIHESGKMVQIGISPWYQTASHQRLEDGGVSRGNFSFGCTYPTTVDNVELLEADIPNAMGVFKLSPELLLSKGRFALESQYYYMNVTRDKDYVNYQAHGVYGMARFLILGDRQYTYSSANAGITPSKPKTLECVVGYSHTNANCTGAGIYGGISNDYSVTFTYNITKWMLARLRYSYTDVRANPEAPDRHVNIIQARVMFKF